MVVYCVMFVNTALVHMNIFISLVSEADSCDVAAASVCMTTQLMSLSHLMFTPWQQRESVCRYIRVQLYQVFVLVSGSTIYTCMYSGFLRQR